MDYAVKATSGLPGAMHWGRASCKPSISVVGYSDSGIPVNGECDGIFFFFFCLFLERGSLKPAASHSSSAHSAMDGVGRLRGQAQEVAVDKPRQNAPVPASTKELLEHVSRPRLYFTILFASSSASQYTVRILSGVLSRSDPFTPDLEIHPYQLSCGPARRVRPCHGQHPEICPRLRRDDLNISTGSQRTPRSRRTENSHILQPAARSRIQIGKPPSEVNLDSFTNRLAAAIQIQGTSSEKPFASCVQISREQFGCCGNCVYPRTGCNYLRSGCVSSSLRSREMAALSRDTEEPLDVRDNNLGDGRRWLCGISC